ncbi:cellulase family glycosylhydrolase [Maribellus sediminis]|uniref:cellulase family glycosylhydrolase n=1 Tax=Maribellus sediminis TaxID=2696285 RepID=UPI0019823E5C|nr:cellulase family glycosylhydrolase [Maribellus sediminis]
MMFRLNQKILVFLSVILFFFSCESTDPVEPVLTVSVSEVNFEAEGGQATIIIDANDSWSTSNSVSWLQLSQLSGSSGSSTIELSTTVNSTGATRSTTLVINSSNGQSRRVKVLQVSRLFPSYNTSPQAPDATGMSSSATELAAKMKLGWNIGNTMEAPAVTAWGNPAITEDYVKAVKQQGFNAIRIPCAWDWDWRKDYSWAGDNIHIEDYKTARIKSEWLNRVKEVVGYCVNNDMYVLLNIHYDGGWLEHNCKPEKVDSVSAKQKAYWEQIATAMRDFDEHLMFASANEPAVKTVEEMEALHTYHQTFINAVRSTGGRNSYRVLVVQGPGTNIEKSNDLMNMPSDEIEGRLMAEVHFYSPSQFCILTEDVSWGKMVYYWGKDYHSDIEPERNATYGEEDEVDQSFRLAKSKFVDKGIPVILGEYGTYRRGNSDNVPKELEKHNNSVDHWITYVTGKALENGLIPFWWDTGGLIDRSDYTVKDKRTLDAIMAGANQ